MERLLSKTEIHEVRKDHAASRRFVKEISLKLRRRRSRDEDDAPSLFEMITHKDQLS